MTLYLLERLFSRVNSPVVNPGRAVSKCWITEVTFVRALSCVDTHVALEGLFLVACAPTHWTDKWCVHMESHVLLQALLPQKPVLTHPTLKVLLSEMHNHVTLKETDKSNDTPSLTVICNIFNWITFWSTQDAMSLSVICNIFNWVIVWPIQDTWTTISTVSLWISFSSSYVPKQMACFLYFNM